jgi:multidrug resistance efflux pump
VNTNLASANEYTHLASANANLASANANLASANANLASANANLIIIIITVFIHTQEHPSMSLHYKNI